MARKRRKVEEVVFDLTPMIDVTFQLLIFFIVTMKFRMTEKRQAADLPLDEGPNPTEAEPAEFIVMRLFWDKGEMIYEVNFKHGNNRGQGGILGGNLRELLDDRKDVTHAHYRKVFGELYDKLKEKIAQVPKAKKVEISTDGMKTTESSKEHIGDTAPWGFVTLALDVCTKLNIERKAAGEPGLGVTFKNTEPAGAVRMAK